MIAIDELIRTRRRTLAIIIQDDGRLVVRAPLRTSARDIHEFVLSKEGWIVARQAQASARLARFAPKQYTQGEHFLYLGESYPLELQDRRSPSLVFNRSFRLARTARPRAHRLFERWYRKRALQVMTERVVYFAALHGFEHHNIKITSARRQWGSCGSNGNLRFAWRLVMAPLPMIDYVVVHELVHLSHKNHSKRFWSRVASILPDFRQREAWLEENGFLLNLA